ncbi:heparinase II/III family protein [Cognatishimia sp. F0-27]|uniref:heparinase II/III family protein n=1 Tax=Cognatishimia sp. F0-27 TaxID=2816855 RepID=UPI001D0CA35D|nr:heparinase II/III family protein [Cognatishimia sp. F0-27]MCC1492205.1 heparinase II/III family protein [Cognatishimia sp. F0-27]
MPKAFSDQRAAGPRLIDRLHARLAAHARPATAFVQQPEPRTVGAFTRGRQLLAGNLLFGGHLVEAPETLLWDVTAPDPVFAAECHGFGWLDDLAAIGDAAARETAQAWLWAWIDRFGKGRGPGWTPDLTGRRVIRWIHHAVFLLRGVTPEQSRAYFAALAAQTLFLARRGARAAPGLPRFEALTGLVYASLALEGMEDHATGAIAGLGADCARLIDEQGGIPTRNPEELLEVFTLLSWALAAIEESGRRPDAAHRTAIERIAPTLRSLRHADGGLARFHGGGRGLEGRLDQALAASGVRRKRREGLAMGFARLAAGRTTVIIDAAPPPKGALAGQAHASSTAFELTSGRRPFIVSCGSGVSFGAKWRRAGRATPSHSTLCLDGTSSARLTKSKGKRNDRTERLDAGPARVPVQFDRRAEGHRIEIGHDGYVSGYGLTHARSLMLSLDGRALEGEEYLVALERSDKKTFDAALDRTRLAGVPFRVHFHLHPDVDVALDMGGTAVSMALRSGEIWVLRSEMGTEITLEPSVYLEKGRLRPRATKQVVLSGRAMEYATRIRWSLAKAQDTAIAVRDLSRDEVDVTS